MAEVNGTAKGQLVVGAIGVGVALLGSIISLYITATSAATKAEELDRRMSAVEVLARESRGDIGVMRSDMREIETQLKAADQVRNVMHANDLRIQSMLWRKSFPGSNYPTDNAYYPTIAAEPH